MKVIDYVVFTEPGEKAKVLEIIAKGAKEELPQTVILNNIRAATQCSFNEAKVAYTNLQKYAQNSI